MINKYFDELSSSDWNKIIDAINSLFINEILSPSETSIVQFFINVINNKDKFQLLKNGNLPNEIDIIYSPSNAVLSWLRASPSSRTYTFEEIKNEPEIHLNHYSFYIGDKLSQRVFDELKVDYSEEFGDEIDDSSSFWDNQFNLEVNFAKRCWQKALAATKTSVIGIFVAGDSSNTERILNH